MPIPHPYPGTPVDLRPLGEALAKTETTALVKNDAFEAIRLERFTLRWHTIWMEILLRR